MLSELYLDELSRCYPSISKKKKKNLLQTKTQEGKSQENTRRFKTVTTQRCLQQTIISTNTSFMSLSYLLPICNVYTLYLSQWLISVTDHELLYHFLLPFLLGSVSFLVSEWHSPGSSRAFRARTLLQGGSHRGIYLCWGLLCKQIDVHFSILCTSCVFYSEYFLVRVNVSSYPRVDGRMDSADHGSTRGVGTGRCHRQKGAGFPEPVPLGTRKELSVGSLSNNTGVLFCRLKGNLI